LFSIMAQNYSQTPIPAHDAPATPTATYRHPSLASQNYGIGLPQEQIPPPNYGPGGYERRQFLQAVPIPALNLGPSPVDCPICGQRRLTSVKYEVGDTTHLWAIVACLCVCLGCIPYLMTSLMDVHHRCGNCWTSLAVWHRSGGTEVLVHPIG